MKLFPRSVSLGTPKSGANSYIVRYVHQSDGLTSGDIPITSTSYTFTNIAAGTYAFHFMSVCGENTSTAFIVIDDFSGF